MPDAIAPPTWVTWNVLNSVAQWYGGQQNNGFVLYRIRVRRAAAPSSRACSTRGSMRLSGSSPYLSIAYAGAQIVWSGAAQCHLGHRRRQLERRRLPRHYGNGDFVTFADGASNPGITVAGGGVSPGSVTISNASTAYSFSGGSIGGSGAFTKAGSGTATLSAANGYSGLTLVKAGTLVVAANNALGTTGNGTVVSNGAALGFQGGVNYSTAEPVTISGGGGGGGALYAVSGNNTFAGPVTLAADSTVGVASGLGLALNDAISGGFSLTKTGGGRLTLAGTAQHLQRRHSGQPGNAGAKRFRRRFPTARSLMLPPARRSMSRRSLAVSTWGRRASKRSKAAGQWLAMSPPKSWPGWSRAKAPARSPS